MKLSALFDNAPDIEIENLMVDSRDVLPNSIFFCIKGMIHDGHRYVNAAVKNGAVCVVHSEDIKRNNANVVYIKVRDVIAARQSRSRPASMAIRQRKWWSTA